MAQFFVSKIVIKPAVAASRGRAQKKNSGHVARFSVQGVRAVVTNSIRILCHFLSPSEKGGAALGGMRNAILPVDDETLKRER